MGIFDRMGKVISSNVNSLLDGAEDDRKLISLNIDEMEEQIKGAYREVVAAVGGEKALRKKAEDLQAECDKWDKRAELALKAGDEPLAREALKQKQRITTDIANAESARTQQRDTALTMKAEYERMKEKLAQIKLRKGSIVARAEQAKAGTEGLGAKAGGGAFANFRRMEEKIEGKEAQSAAMNEVEEALGGGSKQDDLEAQFRALEHEQKGAGGSPGNSAIDDEIAAMKKRIKI